MPTPIAPIEGGVLGDGIVLLVIKLAARPVDVDVPVCTLMLIALDHASFSHPAELPRVFCVQFAIERSIVARARLACKCAPW